MTQFVRLDDLHERLRREFTAGWWVGVVVGGAAGVCLAPLVWVGLFTWGG